MPKDKKMWDNILTVIMSLLCLLWIYPIVLILLNSLKMEGTFTTSTVFKLPTAETFAGLSNYIYGATCRLQLFLRRYESAVFPFGIIVKRVDYKLFTARLRCEHSRSRSGTIVCNLFC